MVQLLVSVSNIDEAKIALDNGVDIIDLKHPERGALGALDMQDIVEIVAFINLHDTTKSKLITATVGDLPLQPALLYAHVMQAASAKVDVVKIGFFNNLGESLETYQACLDELQVLTEKGVKLVAVLFAEYAYPAQMIEMIRNAGFYGVMVDTALKNGATFLDYFSFAQMMALAEKIKKQQLQFGLAGSLKLQHIDLVKQFNPNYIGFRGGLCEGDLRRNTLNANRVKTARNMM
jgi:uncharacterized protein (UPF0264 family)